MIGLNRLSNSLYRRSDYILKQCTRIPSYDLNTHAPFVHIKHCLREADRHYYSSNREFRNQFATDIFQNDDLLYLSTRVSFFSAFVHLYIVNT